MPEYFRGPRMSSSFSMVPIELLRYIDYHFELDPETYRHFTFDYFFGLNDLEKKRKKLKLCSQHSDNYIEITTKFKIS